MAEELGFIREGSKRFQIRKAPRTTLYVSSRVLKHARHNDRRTYPPKRFQAA